MTIPAQQTRNQYMANGSTTVFANSFYITQDADLGVYTWLPPALPVLNTLNVDYTVQNAGNIGGGTFTFMVAPAANTIVVGYRNIAAAYNYEFSNAQTFSGQNLDNALSTVTLVEQQNATNFGELSIKYNPASFVVQNDEVDQTIVPPLGLNEVWLGTGDGNIQNYLLTQNDGILRSQLASQVNGSDGALLVGLFLAATSIGLPANTTIHVALNALVAYMNTLQSNSSGGDGATQIGFYNHNTAEATNVASALEGFTQLNFSRDTVINSNFQVWQRGELAGNVYSTTGALVPCADRWLIGGGGAGAGTITVTQEGLGGTGLVDVIAAGSGSRYGMAIGIAAGSVGTGQGIYNAIFSADTFNGKIITPSFTVYNWTGSPIPYSIAAQQIFNSITPNTNTILGTGNIPAGLSILSATGVIPSTIGATQQNGLVYIVLNIINGVTVIPSFHGLTALAMNVNIGANPVQYTGRDFATEWNACRAFYQSNFQNVAEFPITPKNTMSSDSTVTGALAHAIATANFNINLNPPLIIPPATITVYATSGGTPAPNTLTILNSTANRDETTSGVVGAVSYIRVPNTTTVANGDYGVEFLWEVDTGL